MNYFRQRFALLTRIDPVDRLPVSPLSFGTYRAIQKTEFLKTDVPGNSKSLNIAQTKFHATKNKYAPKNDIK